MSLNHWLEQGLEPEAYMAHLDKHKDGFHNIHNNFQLPEDDEFFNKVKGENLRVVVLAEVWCGHCMLDIPILLRMCEKMDMPVKFLQRDENLELMDQYLTNGNRVIPIFIFINEAGEEVCKWGPIADSVREFTSQFRDKLPAKDSPDYDEAFQKMIQKTGKAFREDENLWNEVYLSIK